MTDNQRQGDQRNTATEPVELSDAELDRAAGGVLVGLLLPAVQKVRVATAR